MEFLLPMLALIGVVIVMAGGTGDGFRGARSILFAIGVVLLMTLIFALIVRPAL